MEKGKKLNLQREVEAIAIPFGKTVSLPAGDEVEIVQAQGGSYSVAHLGRLYLIEGFNADALGAEPTPRPTLKKGASNGELEQFVWDQLRTCYDPEIPIDIVELGLVYGCRIDTLLTGEKQVNIRMTLTAPGCGMGEVIAEDAKRKILGAEQVSKVNVEIVFDPPWNRDMMSDEAKLETGLF